jgi:hypothetical protein
MLNASDVASLQPWDLPLDWVARVRWWSKWPNRYRSGVMAEENDGVLGGWTVEMFVVVGVWGGKVFL